MLQSMHKTSTGLFAKILLFLLIASFALWGIGDMFRTSGSSTLVKVGDETVTAQEFQRMIAREQDMYRRMMGDNYSAELLKSLGIPEKVLEDLVNRSLLTAEARALGLKVPEDALLRTIRENPAFKGESGQFDRAMFQHALANFYQMPESEFAATLSDDILNSILAEALFSPQRTPDSVSKYAATYKQERRKIDLIVLKPDLIQDVPAPNDAELTRYYQEKSESFTAQEQRVFSVLALDMNDMQANAAAPTEEDLLFEYQQNQDQFVTPEKRTVQQLLFETEEAAQKAQQALASGQELGAVAKEYGATNDRFDVGDVTKGGGLPAGEEEVFKLKAGEYSTPVESSFGWHIFKVTAVEPESARPFEEVREQIAEEMKYKALESESYTLANSFQDLLAGGATLEEAANELGLKVKSYGPVSAEGQAPDGTRVDLPEYDNLLTTVFTTEAGAEPSMEETSAGLLYAVRVDNVQPERVRALDEIRASVVEDWKKAQKKAKLRDLAEAAAPKLATSDPRDMAVQLGANFLGNFEVSRDSTRAESHNLSQEFVADIFNRRTGESTNAYQNSDGSYVMARVKSVVTPKDDSTKSRLQIAEAKREIIGTQQDELLNAYLSYLRDKHGVSSVNRPVFDQLNE